MKLFVGLPNLRGDIQHYSRQFNLVEVSAEITTGVKMGTLRRWREKAPPPFCFSVVLPMSVATLATDEASQRDLEHALAIAETLKARWLLLRTPANMMPGPKTERRLEAFVGAIAGRALDLAWEPSGLWEDRRAATVARSLGIHWVTDVLKKEPMDSGSIYTRWQGYGRGPRIRLEGLERAADRLERCESAYVVINGLGAREAAKGLLRLLWHGANASEVEDTKPHSISGANPVNETPGE